MPNPSAPTGAGDFLEEMKVSEKTKKAKRTKKESPAWQQEWPWQVCTTAEDFNIRRKMREYDAKQGRSLPATEDATEPALKAINDAWLATYQRFYHLGLALPSKGQAEYFISLHYNANCVVGFRAEHRGNPELSVTGRNGDQLLERARMLRQAWEDGKRRVDFRACCILAEFTPCVCTVSFKCPIHGSAHHGTHD